MELLFTFTTTARLATTIVMPMVDIRFSQRSFFFLRIFLRIPIPITSFKVCHLLRRTFILIHLPAFFKRFKKFMLNIRS